MLPFAFLFVVCVLFGDELLEVRLTRKHVLKHAKRATTRVTTMGAGRKERVEQVEQQRQQQQAALAVEDEGNSGGGSGGGGGADASMESLASAEVGTEEEIADGEVVAEEVCWRRCRLLPLYLRLRRLLRLLLRFLRRGGGGDGGGGGGGCSHPKSSNRRQLIAAPP